MTCGVTVDGRLCRHFNFVHQSNLVVLRLGSASTNHKTSLENQIRSSLLEKVTPTQFYANTFTNITRQAPDFDHYQNIISRFPI